MHEADSRSLDELRGLVTSFELSTDRPPETIRVQRMPRWRGVELWSIAGSRRCEPTMQDAFGVCVSSGAAGERLGSWWSRGETRDLRDGSIRLLEPGEVHRISELDGEVSHSFIWWSPEVLDAARAELGLVGRARWNAADLVDVGIVQAIRRVFELADASRAAETEAALRDVTHELLVRAGDEALPGRRFSRFHAGVQRAAEYLEDHFREVVSLDELSAHARLSKFHLVRCFGAATGIPPHRYQKLLRLRAARRLLEAGCSVDAAASESGFVDGPHLSRSFRQWLGVAPGTWGRAHRATEVGGRAAPRTTPPPPLAPELAPARRAG